MTKEQLIKELDEMRRRVAELEAEKTERAQAEETLARERTLLRTLIDNMPDFIFVKDAKSRFLLNNSAHLRLLGATSQDEVLDKTDLDVFSGDLAAQYYADEQEVIQAGQPLISREEPYVDPVGNTGWLSTTKVPLRDGQDKIVGLVGISRDITERVRAEQALRASQETYRDIVELAPDGIVTLDLKGVVTSCNPSFLDLTGCARDEIVGKHFTKLPTLRLRDIPRYVKLFSSMIQSKTHEPFEFTWVHKDGATRWGEARISLIKRDRITGLQSIVRDITERVRAQEEMQSLARFPSENRNPVLRVAREGTILYANQSSAPVLAAWDAGVGLKIPETWHQLIADTLDSDESRTSDITFGERIFALDFAPVVEAGYANVYGRDITERVRAQEELRESEERFRAIFENAMVGIYRTTPDGSILAANPALVSMLGYSSLEELAQRNLEESEYEPEYTRAGFRQRVETEGQVRGIESVWVRHDGTALYVRESTRAVRDEAGNTLYYEGTVEDATARVRAEEALKEYSERLEEMVEERTRELEDAREELIRKEKLAMLGQLAGSVGHELRNPLGVISNTVYYLRMILPDADETTRECLDTLSSGVRNATKIISDLLDFARIKSVDRQAAIISELAAQALAQCPTPDNVQVKVQILADLPTVFVDPFQIGQVLTNLITNAYDAMPEGGVLTISAGAKESQVALSVTDTGCGISEENMIKIFEPLFTTKAQGIGLGLALSKNLVEANGGRIEVESTMGQGSRFTLVLSTKEEIL